MWTGYFSAPTPNMRRQFVPHYKLQLLQKNQSWQTQPVIIQLNYAILYDRKTGFQTQTGIKKEILLNLKTS